MGDPSRQELRGGALKKGREEIFLQNLLHRAERLPNVRGDALDEIPLLLEGLL